MTYRPESAIGLHAEKTQDEKAPDVLPPATIP